MKKILITGANSYIGTTFTDWMKQYGGYLIDTVDTLSGAWKNKDFSGYDAVFHVAGIAHSMPRADMKELYYKVNTELAVSIAEYAKKCGVRQFIFMSSIIVYGSKNPVIYKDTPEAPENFYGDSKLQADIRLHKMEDESFKVCSIRPPMVYGKGSKGNYPKLSRLAKKTKIFPSIKNQRSMLHVENLCEFVRLIIDNEESGYFYPQNKEYVGTAQLVKTIAEISGNKMVQTGIFNPILSVLSKKITVFNKLFGSLAYDKELSRYMDFAYCVNDFEESIKRTEEQ